MVGAEPSIVVLAGPNGAGKTTAAPFLLRDTLAVGEFVNADVIAQGLAASGPEAVAVEAGRLMLARPDELARQRASLAFETTLASRTFAPWLRARRQDGYSVHLVFLWLESPDLAVARVARRVARGGHSIPEAIIRRRYAGGLRNFFLLYQALTTTWSVYNTSGDAPPQPLAAGEGTRVTHVDEPPLWQQIMRQWGSP